MPSSQIPAQSLDDLRGRFRGALLEPDDPGYDETRSVHNGYIDRRPALIACCRTTGDVVDAVRFAREHELEIAIRGGGHSVAGRCVSDDALMVDLAPMKGIHVDRDRRTARAQGGVTWGELNRETQLFGLATTGGVVSTTGIAGLTLGGGIGWLMGKHGLTVDNLLSAEVVLADGSVVTASEDSEPDLYWAIRGGGGNFGVVTSFEYRLHPVTTVTAGLVAHPFERSAEMLRFYREITSELPDEVVIFGGLVHAPDGSGTKLGAMVLCDCREPGTDDGLIQRIKEFGPPLIDALQPVPYAHANELLDGGYPKGAFNYWKSSFIEDLTDDAIDLMVDRFSEAPSPMDAMLLEHFHGAMTRVPVEATAFPHRQPGYSFAAMGEWMDPELGDRCIAWVRDAYAAMEPHRTPSRYVNYMGDDELPEEVATAYGPNLPRLRAVKSKYDPDNIFHLNQNIEPAEEGAAA